MKFTVHFVVFPASLEDSAVAPGVGAQSVDGVVLELTFVGGVVRPGELSVSMFLTLEEVSLVDRAVFPLLSAEAMFSAVLPSADVSSIADSGFQLSLAIGHVVGELSYVN